MPANPTVPYDALTKILHWTTAVLIIGLIGLGWYMVDLTYYDRWFNASLSAHKSIGMIALALSFLSILWRIYRGAPAPVATLKPWERVAAKTAHTFLYVMMLAIPVSGYLVSTSEGAAVSVFGWFAVPPVVKVDEGLREVAVGVHYYLAYAMSLLVAIHGAAAFKHQFIDKDGTLGRMLR
ncbi:MAG: cytochrome b [Gammaproteobacteria bacterium]|jgi:cytochrome b561